MVRILRAKGGLYLLLAIPMAWYLLFRYYPMYGAQLAFRKFNPRLGIAGSPWMGLYYFQMFFSSYYFGSILWNTLSLNLYQLAVGFPIPILLALLIHEIDHRGWKKLVQNVTYIPHFLSVVVVVGMLNIFLNEKYGAITRFLTVFGLPQGDYMAKANAFQTVYVLSNVWQHMGWNSIIYIAALTAIDPSLYEAATIDGATRMQKIRHISIPCLLPTIIVLFILQAGNLMDVGFEKVLLMQNTLNTGRSEVISTLVYKQGIQKGQYSYTTAVGLFNSAINFVILISVNTLAKRVAGHSLW
ncbi:MAG TPA: ABC transporter permease subunit [Clostridia bacterium]|nr:ABC transporter permease subunit [Clostridia bacterium]